MTLLSKSVPLGIALLLAGTAAQGAHAAEPAPAPPCDAASAAASPPAWQRDASEGVGSVDLGVAARWTLETQPTFLTRPGRAPAPGSRGIAIPLLVRTAGTYRVMVDQRVWIDMLTGNGVPVASAAHEHGPRCSGITKMVDFTLEPGDYVIQLSGTAAPAVRLLIQPQR